MFGHRSLTESHLKEIEAKIADLRRLAVQLRPIMGRPTPELHRAAEPSSRFGVGLKLIFSP
jgi:hypothetical protein